MSNAGLDMLKLLKIKFQNKHPSRKKMVQFVKRHRNELQYKIYRCPSQMKFEDTMAGYYQYLTLSVQCDISMSSLEISTLPYKEIIDLLEIDDHEFEDSYYLEE